MNQALNRSYLLDRITLTENENTSLRAEVEQLRYGIGCMTTIKGDMVMRVDDPLGMAQEAVRYVEDIKQQNSSLEEYMRKGVVFRDELQAELKSLRARIVELEDERDRWYRATHERMIKINGLESTCRVQAKLIADQRNEIAVALTKIENLKERVTVGRRMDSETIDAKDRTIRRLVDQNNAIQQVDENADLRARIEDVPNIILGHKSHWQETFDRVQRDQLLDDVAAHVEAWLKEKK
jgi:chromosome segregation ATPase